MKKIIPILLALIVGLLCAFILFKKVDARTTPIDLSNAIAIQIGVFTKKENAQVMSEKYGGCVFEDDGLYRVYFSVLANKKNIEFITEYLQTKSISYYLKKITLPDEVLKKGETYEELMQKAKDKTKLAINENILNFYTKGSEV